MSVVFHRPLLLDVFRVAAETTREGKKVRTVRAQMSDVQDRLVATADALLIRTAAVDVETTPATTDPSRPTTHRPGRTIDTSKIPRRTTPETTTTPSRPTKPTTTHRPSRTRTEARPTKLGSVTR